MKKIQSIREKSAPSQRLGTLRLKSVSTQWLGALTLRLLLAGLLIVAGGSEVRAWDSEPNEKGLYDGLYDRPTHFPEWSQPSTWPNAMYYLCDVHLGAADGPQVPSYEIAVYDQNGELRHCGRSIPKDNNLCVLTIRGEDGVDTFHFKVIYGDDFANPFIVDVPDVTVQFKTNDQVGTPTNPFLLVLPGRTYLNETDADAPSAKEDVDVTVKRTINAGEWSTICLPFEVAADKMDAAFGEGWKLGNFTGCEVAYEDDEETVKSIKVKFEDATAIEANHPYIIKVVNDVTEINVDGVDIEAEEEPSVDCDRIGKGTKKDPYKWNSFVGNYENGFLVPEQTLFLSGGKFWYSVGSTPMMAYRAYFDFYDVLPEVDATEARISLSFDGNETAVESVAMPSQQTEQVYDLQGRRVSGQLKRGIYIKNNKKVFVGK